MSATKVPVVGLPTAAQTVTLDYAPGVGESQSQEWSGEYTECLGKYNGLVAQSKLGGYPGNNIRSVQLRSDQGRARVVAQFARKADLSISGVPDDVVIVKELYAVDIVRDVTASAYFVTGGGAAVSDDEAVIVRKCVQRGWAESEIIVPNVPAAYVFTSWSAAMKEVRYHLAHGQESYYETAFILRRSKTGIQTSQIKEAFTNINAVVTAPTFATDMDKLILALPAGEWLYKPPQAEYIGEGKWRVTQEWHWAAKWSKMYGGTWGTA
jgi:hypothetical protein